MATIGYTFGYESYMSQHQAAMAYVADTPFLIDNALSSVLARGLREDGHDTMRQREI